MRWRVGVVPSIIVESTNHQLLAVFPRRLPLRTIWPRCKPGLVCPPPRQPRHLLWAPLLLEEECLGCPCRSVEEVSSVPLAVAFLMLVKPQELPVFKKLGRSQSEQL